MIVRRSPAHESSRAQAAVHNEHKLGCLNWDSLLDLCSSSHSALGAFAAEHNKFLSPYFNLVEYLNPALLITMANKADNPTYSEAMNGPDASGFIEAMEKEMLTLIQLNVFEIMERAPKTNNKRGD